MMFLSTDREHEVDGLQVQTVVTHERSLYAKKGLFGANCGQAASLALLFENDKVQTVIVSAINA